MNSDRQLWNRSTCHEFPLVARDINSAELELEKRVSGEG